MPQNNFDFENYTNLYFKLFLRKQGKFIKKCILFLFFEFFSEKN